MKKLLNTILLAASISVAATAQDISPDPVQVWTELDFLPRFEYELSNQPCTDWSDRADLAVLFPEDDMSCVNILLERLKKSMPVTVPSVPRSGGFRANRFFTEWELIGYEGLWRNEIFPEIWKANLAPFGQLTITQDNVVKWTDGNEIIEPTIKNFWLNPYGVYEHKRRRGNLPSITLQESALGYTEVTFSNCIHNLPTCMLVKGVNYLKDGSTMTGWLVYRKKNS